MTRLILSAVIAACAGVLVPSVAEACSCAAPDLSPTAVAPLPDATEVPLNAKIWIGVGRIRETTSLDGKTFTLKDSAGTAIAATASTLMTRYSAIRVLTPVADLAANTIYSVTSDEETIVTFTTGTSRDDTAPARPAITSSESVFYESDGYDSCGSSYGASFVLQTDDILTVMIQDEKEVDASTFEGDATQLIFPGLTQTDTAYRAPMIGMSGCFTNWPDAKRGATTQVRFGTFDIAGNFSGYTDAAAVQIPDPQAQQNTPPESGCHTAGAGALALLGLLARRRSR